MFKYSFQNKYFYFILWVFLVIVAYPLNATPDRITHASDRLVAANQTHYYVLRDISDNHGSYFYARHDQYLVEISFSDGAATQHWLLRSMKIVGMDEVAHDQVPGIVTDFPTQTHNMMEILADRKATPMYMRNGFIATKRPLSIKHDDNGTMIGLFANDHEQILSAAQISTALASQFSPMESFYAPLQTQEDYLDRTRISFSILQNETNGYYCTLPSGPAYFRFRSDTVSKEFRLFPIRCEDGWGQSIAGHLKIPVSLWDR